MEDEMKWLDQTFMENRCDRKLLISNLAKVWEMKDCLDGIPGKNTGSMGENGSRGSNIPLSKLEVGNGWVRIIPETEQKSPRKRKSEKQMAAGGGGLRKSLVKHNIKAKASMDNLVNDF